MRTAAVLACGICRHQLYVLVLSWMAVLGHRFYNYLLIPVDVDLRGRTASLAFSDMLHEQAFAYEAPLQDDTPSLTCVEAYHRDGTCVHCPAWVGHLCVLLLTTCLCLTSGCLAERLVRAKVALCPAYHGKHGTLLDSLSAGGLYLLQPRFTDYTTTRVLKALASIQAQVSAREASGSTMARPLFMQLVDNPVEFSEASPGQPAVTAAVCAALETPVRVAAAASMRWHVTRPACLRQVPGLPVMTPSQRSVFAHVVAKRGTVVWGPPGSGKTFFSAAAISRCAVFCCHVVARCVHSGSRFAFAGRLVRAHQRARPDAPFRVMITAYTKAAASHLVAQLVKLNTHCSSRLPIAELVSDAAGVSGDTVPRFLSSTTLIVYVS